MSLVELVAEVERRGILLQADGDRLHVDFPTGAMTDELRARIRDHKPALLALFKPSPLVWLKGGLTVPAAVIQAAWELEAAGFTLGVDDDQALTIHPVSALTELQRAAVVRWRHHLAAVVAYRPPAS